MNKDDKKDFTSAMGDLKGMLDKEGINIGRPVTSNDTISTFTADLLDNELITQFEEQQKATGLNPDDFTADLNNENTRDNPDLPVLDGTITVTDASESPDLDDYIADIDDDNFDVLEFADSVEDLEQTVASITDPEDLKKFEQQAQKQIQTETETKTQAEPQSATITPIHEPATSPETSTGVSFNEISEAIHYEQLKEKLHKQLSFQIELSVAELKTKLLDNLEAELEAAFKKL